MKRPHMLFLGALALIAAGLVAWDYYRPRRPAPVPIGLIEDDRENLRRIVAQLETDSARALADYQPKAQQKITDLGADAEVLLRGLPGVVDVTGVKVEKPTHRIIHFRGFHTISREWFAIDHAAVYGRALTAHEIDVLHEQLFLQVESLQVEHLAILRCLIRHHGLTTIHLEGLTADNAGEFADKVAGLKAMELDEIPKLRSILKNMGRFAKEAQTQELEKAREETTTMLDQHRRRMLEMGVAGRLLIAGDLKRVLPLDDVGAMKEATPVRDGKLTPDAAKAAARNDAQVRELLKVPVTVIELGGSHDLSAAVKRVADGKCEYLRVTTKRARQLLD